MTNNFTRKCYWKCEKNSYFLHNFLISIRKQWQYFSEHENSSQRRMMAISARNVMSIKSIKFSIVSPRNSILKYSSLYLNWWHLVWKNVVIFASRRCWYWICFHSTQIIIELRPNSSLIFFSHNFFRTTSNWN